MMDRLLDKFPLLRPVSWRRPGSAGAQVRRSVHVLPILALHEPGEPGEHQQKQHDPYAKCAARRLRRFADVVEEINSIAHEAVVLRGAEASRGDLLEVVKHLLWDGLTTLSAAACFLVHGALESLELREHVRHGRRRQRSEEHTS